MDCTLLGDISGVNGSGVLANVEFHVAAVGECSLDLCNTTLVSSDQLLIDHQSTDGYGYFTGPHDVAVLNVLVSPTIVLPGEQVQINVTVENQGDYPESFNVTTYNDSEAIGTQPLSLDSKASTNLTFSWNTTGVSKGDYTISAEASQVSGETDTTDNIKSADSTVTVLTSGHDIALTAVYPSKTVVGQGFLLNISVTTKNYGTFTETFNATVYHNQTAITQPDGKNYTTLTLTSGDSRTLTFTWNTTGTQKGNYTISANLTLLPDETDLSNNNYIDGWVLLTIPGDVNGDRIVDLKDVFGVALAYGSFPGHPMWDPNLDINSDHTVDLKDYFTTVLNYGENW